MAEQQLVDEGNQRSSASTSGDAAFPEFGYRADSGPLGDDSRIPDLKRAGNAVSQVFNRRALVENGLPVHADQPYGLERHAAMTGLPDGVGVEFAQQKMKTGDDRGMGHTV